MRWSILPLLLLLTLAACSGQGRDPILTPDADAAQADAAGEIVPGDSLPPADVVPDLCQPQCEGKECGDDGCGGSCGKCPAAAPLCDEQGLCQVQCIPDCEGKECGDDGCGGDCGKCPKVAPYCVQSKCAVECEPDCDGKACGDDGCDGECGTCDGPQELCEAGQCVCQPACEGKECGDDGCGGSCGECSDETPFCQEGQCIDACKPDCNGKECGPDGCDGNCGKCEGAQEACKQGQCVCQPDCPPDTCGSDGCGGKCPGCACDETCVDGWCQLVGCATQECGPDGCGAPCGECPSGAECIDDLCIDSCEAACQGKECGPDGCGGWCGQCAAGLTCTDAGLCVGQCTPSCAGKECGPNGCGGSCGVCAFMQGSYCVAGHCVSECPADCDGKACGDDGCGGSCGQCQSPFLCTESGSCGGYCSQCTFHPGCYDLDFGTGSVGDWNLNATGLVTHLGQTTAPTGGYMLKLTTGEGLTEFDSSATFQDCLPGGAYMMLVKWRFYSEEFKEWCGSNFQDSFTFELSAGGATETLATYTIDALCPPDACAGCGSAFDGLMQSDVIFDQGGVFNTSWREEWMPVNLVGDESLFTLKIALTDAGDGIFDSVLLVDRIRFVPCAEACDYVECGTNPCGDECGSCNEGGICQGGTCCYPSCEGKECGSDGCGGSCGQCGSLTACSQEGMCECKFEECIDGCCTAGEVCAAISGKCCLPNCSNKPCQSDGCGGQCPAANGSPCCQADAECDDGDPCTADLCTGNVCGHTPITGPGCCEPLVWQKNFDTGTAEGFTLQNSGGGPFPGMEGGWQVSDLCGSHSAPYALYFGMGNGIFGQCIYSIGFPLPEGLSGTATSPSIKLPAGTPALSFWYVADILPLANDDLLKLEVIKSGQASTLWSKNNVPQLGPNWQKANLSLAAWSGQTISLRWSFQTSGGQQAPGMGVLVDDILITNPCAP